MHNIQKKDHKVEIILLAIYIALIFGLYNIFGQIVSLRGIDLSYLVTMPLDYTVKLVPSFVLAYNFVYIYPVMILVYLVLHPKVSLVQIRVVFLAVSVLFAVHYLIWIAFPTSLEPLLKSADVEGAKSSVFYGLLLKTYASISPWNSFPSFHVSSVWFLYRTVSHYIKHWTSIVFFTIAILIILSISFIKVHYIADAVSAVIVTEIVYNIFFIRRYNQFHNFLSNIKSNYIIKFAIIASIIILFLIIGGLKLIGVSTVKIDNGEKTSFLYLTK